jgi:hypothetical protein
MSSPSCGDDAMVNSEFAGASSSVSRSCAHISPKPSGGDDRGRLRNVNADPWIPNEDAAIRP